MLESGPNQRLACDGVDAVFSQHLAKFKCGGLAFTEICEWHLLLPSQPSPFVADAATREMVRIFAFLIFTVGRNKPN